MAIRFRCPASFKSTDYLVTIIMQVDLESTFAVKPVKKILRVDCTPGKGGEPCKASGFGHKHTYDKCTHCSAALQVRWHRPRGPQSRCCVAQPRKALVINSLWRGAQVLQNLMRLDTVSINRDHVPCTAQLQRWHEPCSCRRAARECKCDVRSLSPLPLTRSACAGLRHCAARVLHPLHQARAHAEGRPARLRVYLNHGRPRPA